MIDQNDRQKRINEIKRLLSSLDQKERNEGFRLWGQMLNDFTQEAGRLMAEKLKEVGDKLREKGLL